MAFRIQHRTPSCVSLAPHCSNKSLSRCAGCLNSTQKNPTAGPTRSADVDLRFARKQGFRCIGFLGGNHLDHALLRFALGYDPCLPTAFQRPHMSILSIAESLTRLPCAINTTSREKIYIQMVLHRPVELAVFFGNWPSLPFAGAPSKARLPGGLFLFSNKFTVESAVILVRRLISQKAFLGMGHLHLYRIQAVSK